MKLLLTTIAAVVLVGCATTQQSEPPTALGDILSGALGGEYNMGRPLDEEERRLIEELRAQGVYVPQERKVSPFRYGAGTVSKRNLQDIRDAIKPEQERRMKELMRQRSEAARQAAAVEKFNQDKAPDISIHDAAREGNIEAVKQHLAAGTDVNAKTDRGRTPLLIAVTLGNKEIAELLIAKGADVNVSGNGGMTPLHSATLWQYKEVVELLIAAGADVNAKDEDGRTPLKSPTSSANTAARRVKN